MVYPLAQVLTASLLLIPRDHVTVSTRLYFLPRKAHLVMAMVFPGVSTLAWKIPWKEEPGGLQSIGSLRVGHD